jgi:hypothetical protein
MSTRNILGGKGGRYVRLTTSPPSRAECHEIWEPKPPGNLWTTPGLLRDSFTLQANDCIDVRTEAEAFWNEMLWATIVLSKETVNVEQRKEHNKEIHIIMLVIKWQRFR